MTDTRFHDRRSRVPRVSLMPGSRLCRLCLRVALLEPERIEVTDQHVYLRCPHCRGSFPIRRDDIKPFLGTDAPGA